MSGLKRRLLDGLTRRQALAFGAGATISLANGPVLARTLLRGTEGMGDATTSHGLSIFGDLKYAADFSHLDYINPDAPKGGRIVLQAGSWFHNQNPQTFNTLNGYVTRGDAPPRLELIFDSLMARAFDEPDAIYGLVAESITISEDGNSYIVALREGTKFADGSDLTAYDVAFSLMTLKEEGHPDYSQPFRRMVSAQALSDRVVRIDLDGTQSRGLIFQIADSPIFSKAYYQERDFTAATMEPPLASGPYSIGAFEPGRFIEYVRNDDYWAADLPIMRGHANFDSVRVEFYRERQAAFEAFKKGDITFREEFTSKRWATEYNFPAVEEGRVAKELFPRAKRPSFQGNFFNTRLDKFKDPRTREAIGLCFDFEWVNENLFYGIYARLASYLGTSDYAARGMPDGDELVLLEPYRDQLPANVFDEVYVPPKSDGSGRDRALLRRASELLREAGWQRDGTALKNADGETLSVEILVRSPVFERIYGKFVETLELVGVGASIRVVDPAQFQARTNDFDFEMAGFALSLEATPFSSGETLFGSDAADTPGARNWAGIKDPALDGLIATMEQAPDRARHRTAWRAIDRVLRAGHYWVPGWYSEFHRVAVWDGFGWPDDKPDYYFPVETTWWSKG